MHGPDRKAELKAVSCQRATWFLHEGGAPFRFRRQRAYDLTETSSFLLQLVT